MAGIITSILLNKLNLNSYFIVAYAALWIADGGLLLKWNTLKSNGLFRAFAALFVLQIAGFFMAQQQNEGIKHLETKIGYIVLPALLLAGPFPNNGQRRQIMTAHALIATTISIILLGMAYWKFRENGLYTNFFYHDLLLPIEHNAIYFSAFVFFSFCFLLNEGQQIQPLQRNKWIYYLWLLFHLTLLILLASKLIISITLLYTTYWILNNGKEKNRYSRLFAGTGILIVIISLAAVVIIKPIRQRFTETFQANWSTLNYDQFTPSTSFTGLQFRLLTWRFGYEILQEENAFIIGVGPANAQTFLQEKYREMNMYTGTAGSQTDKGFLVYNFHDQYLQTWVESGIIGAIILFCWYVTLITIVLKRKNRVLTGMILLICLLSFTESIFTRQWGMILSSFFPLLYVRNKQ
ncbi:MAG: O-antigen ligase family protein [Chitinophagaceae bacterium]